MRYLILIISLSLSTAAFTQSNDSARYISPGFIALYVHNIDSMMAWYENKLGFKILKHQKANNGLAFTMMEWEGIWIEMIQNPKVTTRTDLRSTFKGNGDVEGFFKLGFRCQSLEALYNRLQQNQVKIRYPMLYNEHFEMNLFIIEDPEGNWIQFYNTPRQK